jgi:hypothetical protein
MDLDFAAQLMKLWPIFLGLTIIGLLAYLGIKGTNEAIDYQNKLSDRK